MVEVGNLQVGPFHFASIIYNMYCLYSKKLNTLYYKEIKSILNISINQAVVFALIRTLNDKHTIN